MKKLPQIPDEIFADYVADWRTAYGEGLEAIVLYGSAARGEYVPGKSDLNFLIVLTSEAIANLRQAVLLTEKWRQRAIAVPLVLTQEYIHASLDSFPIEFLNMKQHHRTVFGPDILAALEISKANLRLQLEREIKGKLLHLREGLLGTGYDRNRLQELIGQTIPAFIPLFEAFLFLRAQEIPMKRREVFQKVAQVAQLEESFINDLFHLQETERPYREELWKFMENYIAQIKKLAQVVDAM